MNMLFSFGELIPLHQNLKIAENQELFAKNLYDLLHGEDELMERFNRFCDILTILQADKWVVEVPKNLYQEIQRNNCCWQNNHFCYMARILKKMKIFK